jgi:hypothetical protein
MEEKKVQAVRQLAVATAESVKEAGEHGCPGGTLYAALMGTMNLEQFESFMRAMVRAGMLRKKGDLYFVAGRP